MIPPATHPILAGLNERQKEAVTATDGPVLVIAGPGSGKTRALTHRIAYLIASGADPGQILAVTFTNRAAEEMRQRIAGLLRREVENDETGESASGLGEVEEKQLHQAKRFTKRSDSTIFSSRMPFIGTFHSFAASLLRREAGLVGYRPEFTIYDEDDRSSLLREIMKEERVDPKRFPVPMIASAVSDLKADLTGPEEFLERAGSELFPRTVALIYAAYQRRLKFSNAMDFDDLIFLAVRLLAEHQAARTRVQDRFRYLHVDEYQDTSSSQYQLLRLISGQHRNIFAIGDDAQSVYAWRRADYRNILNFERDWPEARVVFLEENYRSTPEILEAANHVIHGNRDQKPKTLWTKNPPGRTPQVRAHENERREAEFIASEITTLRKAGMPWLECAVLYRTNAQSRAIEEAMIEHGIPYTIVGGIRFFHRREIKDLLAYLRYLSNPDDALALKRIVNVPARGIGPKTLLAYLGGHASRLAPRDRQKVAAFEQNVTRLRDVMSRETLAGFLRFLIKTIGYEIYLNDISQNNEDRIENVRELVSLARQYDALPIGEAVTKLLEEAALLSEQDEISGNAERIKLMTLHAAKGLEFKAVFLTGLEEGLLPHAKSIQGGRAELEEERRLAYVGMTRAKERLYLTWAVTRTIFGERIAAMPSRFLRELPQELLTGQDEIPDDSEMQLVDES